ncbi:MAG TPA: PadR family transcriptional regulator [Streptosporangiaceae bacterium]
MHNEDDWSRRGRGRRGEWRPEPGDFPEMGPGPEAWGPSRRGPQGRGRMRHAPGPPWMRDWTGEEPRRRARVQRGDVRAAALALLAEEPRNGYQVIQEIAERSGGVWQPSPGSVYPALQQLEDEGLIRAETADSGRKSFALTDEGRAYVASHASEVAAPWDVVAGREHGGVREMRALVGQLAMAAMQVTSAGTDAQIAEAKKILSDTRRNLYRILAAEDSGQEAEEGGPEGDTADSAGPR